MYGDKNGCPDSVIQGFTILFGGKCGRRIERLLCISHVSVINWLKKSAKQIIKEKSKKRPTEIDILELGEMFVNFKRISGCGPLLIESARN